MRCPSCQQPVSVGASVLLVRCKSCDAKFAAEDALPDDDLALGEIPPELMPGSATFDPTAGVVTEDTVDDVDSTEPSVSKPAAGAIPRASTVPRGSWLPPGVSPPDAAPKAAP